MTEWVDYLTGAMLVVGSFFILVAAIGLVRLDDLFMRMHAASKAGTLGAGLLFLALAIDSGEFAVAIRALVGIMFFLLTAPVSAHLLARAAYAVGYKPHATTHHDALFEASDTDPDA